MIIDAIWYQICRTIFPHLALPGRHLLLIDDDDLEHEAKLASARQSIKGQLVGMGSEGGWGRYRCRLKFGQETSLLQTIMMTICNAMNSPPQNGRQENFGHKRNLYFFLHNPRPGKPTLKVRLRLIFCRATHRIFHFCKIFSQNFTLLFCRHAIWEYFDRNSLRHCSTVNQDSHCNNRFWSSELRQLQGMSNSLDTFLLKTFKWVYDPDQVISFNIGE